ncbi:unnamed protein product, partial [Phaeothamnion confervicola]
GDGFCGGHLHSEDGAGAAAATAAAVAALHGADRRPASQPGSPPSMTSDDASVEPAGTAFVVGGSGRYRRPSHLRLSSDSMTDCTVSGQTSARGEMIPTQVAEFALLTPRSELSPATGGTMWSPKWGAAAAAAATMACVSSSGGGGDGAGCVLGAAVADGDAYLPSPGHCFGSWAGSSSREFGATVTPPLSQLSASFEDRAESQFREDVFGAPLPAASSTLVSAPGVLSSGGGGCNSIIGGGAPGVVGAAAVGSGRPGSGRFDGGGLPGRRDGG